MTGRPNSLAARDIASLIHPYTNLEKHKADGPLVIARGDGVYVYDEAGTRYLEGMAGLWSTSLGFSEKRRARIDAALAEEPVAWSQAETLAPPWRSERALARLKARHEGRRTRRRFRRAHRGGVPYREGLCDQTSGINRGDA